MNALEHPARFQTSLSRLDVRHPDVDLWRNLFLRNLRLIGSPAPTCDATGFSTREYREAVQSDPEFREAVQNIQMDVADDLEAEGLRRARMGSDILLMFMLKKMRPEYRDNMPPPVNYTQVNTKTYIGFDPDSWDKLTRKTEQITINVEPTKELTTNEPNSES